jgi:hypothetical protein
MAIRAPSENSDEGALRIPTGLPPDPTPRTAQQILRENFWLRELIETRLDGMDKALGLLQAFTDRTPTTMDVQHEVTALREVVMEKFGGINTTFSQNDKALAAALQAQEKQAIATNENTKTANTKMEDSFTKQIDAINIARIADVKGVDDKIDAVKERLTIIESKTSISDPSTAITLAKLDATVARLTSSGDVGTGRQAEQAANRASQIALWAVIFGAVGLLVAIGTFVTMLMKFGH